jgi:hypothetical protein
MGAFFALIWPVAALSFVVRVRASMVQCVAQVELVCRFCGTASMVSPSNFQRVF